MKLSYKMEKTTQLEAQQSTKRVAVNLTLVGILTLFLIGIVSAQYPAYLQDELVSCWTFDETSGTNVVDYGAGQQNNGTNNGMVQGANSSTTSLGKAYFYDGTSTKNVSMTPSASLNLTGNVSILVVFNTTTATGDLELANGRTNTAGYPLAVTSDKMHFKPVVTAPGTAVIGTALINTGDNVLAIATRYDANGTIYLNGTLEVTGNVQAGSLLNSPTWSVGGTGALNSKSFYVSEIAVFNSTLNSTDASIIWNSGNITTCKQSAPATPTITLISPSNRTATTETTNYFIANVTNTSSTIAIKNVSLYLNGTINQTNTSQINGTYNFSVALPVGVYAWTIKAYGNDSVQYNATNGTFTIAVNKISFTSSNYSVQAIEQSSQTYRINFTIGSAYAVSSVNFTYNQTNYSASFSAVNSSYYQATATLTTPSVTSNVNKTFNWSVFLTDGSRHISSDEQQTILNFGVDNCTTNTLQILNFTLYDEDTRVFINGTGNNSLIKVDVELYPNGSLTSPTFSFSGQYSQTNPARVCVNSTLTNSIFYMNTQVQYETDNHSTEFYNIQNYSLNATSNPSENISLYDLNVSRAQEYTIRFKDETFLPVTDALIQVQRKYLETGNTLVVEAPLTDTNGEAVVHLISNDVIYSFFITKNGEVLATFSNVYAICQNPSINDCEINLNSFSSNIPATEFQDVSDFSYTLTYDSSNRYINTTFTIPSNAVSWVTLNVTKSDALGTSLCNQSVTSSAGSLGCVIGSNFGNGTAIAKLYKDGELVGQGSIKLDQNPSDIWGGTMVFLGLMLILTLVGAGMSDSPVFTIIFFIVGVMLLFALNLVANNGFVGSTATILWVIIAVVLVIIKGARRS